MGHPVHLDAWASSILVDPLGKLPLIRADGGATWVATYGRQFPICDGISDLRLLNNKTTADQRKWKEGQVFYEQWEQGNATIDSADRYRQEREGVSSVYQDIPITGKCLDVGGHQGRLRAFLSPGQPYVACDPFMTVFRGLENQPGLLAAYPMLRDPVNFVCCDAEFLPFRERSFDCVHMRSVIDHFLNPELALLEAHRVLGDQGYLVVGLLVHGGRTGRTSAYETMKESAKSLLSVSGFKQFGDHHIWHPTFEELQQLIVESGFSIDKVHWQKGHSDNVCYIKATKTMQTKRLSYPAPGSKA